MSTNDRILTAERGCGVSNVILTTDANESACPHCGGARNSDGGERCFHCADCGWMTCVDLNPEFAKPERLCAVVKRLRADNAGLRKERDGWKAQADGYERHCQEQDGNLFDTSAERDTARAEVQRLMAELDMQRLVENRLREASKEDAARMQAIKARTTAVVKWLERNEPSVFHRGFWEAVAEAEAALAATPAPEQQLGETAHDPDDWFDASGDSLGDA